MVAKDQLDTYAAGMHFRLRTGKFNFMDPSEESGQVMVKWDERRKLTDPPEAFEASFSVDIDTALMFPNGYQNYAEQAQFMAGQHRDTYWYSRDMKLVDRFLAWIEAGDVYEDDGTYVPPSAELFDWGIIRSGLKMESQRVNALAARLQSNRHFAITDPFEYEQ